MKVYGKCKSCGYEMGCKTDAHTRVEFAMKDGETKTLNCKNCGTNTKFHVDELYAKPSNMPIITVGLIFMAAMILLVYQLFFPENNFIIILVGLPIGIYLTLKKQDQTRVSNFNKRKLKGRTHHVELGNNPNN